MGVPSGPDILAKLKRAGVEVREDEGRLLIRDPKGGLAADPQLRNELRRFRDSVICALQHPPQRGFKILRPVERRQEYADVE